MSVPKRRKTHSKTRMGRAHKKLSKIQTTGCSNCKQPVLAHQVCTACGFYKGVQVMRTKEEIMTKREAKKKAREDRARARK